MFIKFYFKLHALTANIFFLTSQQVFILSQITVNLEQFFAVHIAASLFSILKAFFSTLSRRWMVKLIKAN